MLGTAMLGTAMLRTAATCVLVADLLTTRPAGVPVVLDPIKAYVTGAITCGFALEAASGRPNAVASRGWRCACDSCGGCV